MLKTKIIAMYLPQYHCIPENDEFWGKGFTDWVTVKKASSLFEWHNQPRVPLNDNYYDLSQKKHIKWEVDLAKEAGVYGFGVYHYWFNNDKNILTKPAEIIRDNKDININYFLAWDNCSWVRSWSNVAGNAWSPLADKKPENKGPQVLIPYILGGEKDWENHYNSLRDHFKEDRYIKINGKPLFFILGYSPEIAKMADYWNMLAKKDGFEGVQIVYRNLEFKNIPNNYVKFNYEPCFSGWTKNDIFSRVENKFKLLFRIPKKLRVFDYDVVWKKILGNVKRQQNEAIFAGCFVRYDDTPRRGKQGIIVKGESPEKFKKYMEELLNLCQAYNKEYVFLTAWNEWGEGAYLEPDTTDGFAYIKALRAAIDSLSK